MGDAETSAYVLMAAGLVWILVGIVGLARRPRDDRHDRREADEHADLESVIRNY
jgi:hypothetical protein